MKGKQGPIVDQSVATKDSRKSLIDALLTDCGEDEENMLADQEIEELSFLDADVKEESVMVGEVVGEHNSSIYDVEGYHLYS